MAARPEALAPTCATSRCPPTLQIYGIVLPSLPLEACQKGSSEDNSSLGGSGTSSPAMQEVPCGGAAPAEGGRQGGRAGGKSELVEAIASGMRRSGMTPGVVRPPAMVAGKWGACM